MKPKLLVLTSTFPRWKDDTDPPFVFELSKRLTSDFDVMVLAPHYPGANREEEINGLKIYRYRYFVGRFEKLSGSTGILPTLKQNKLYWLLVPFFLVSQFFALIFISRKLRPDIIHAHWIISQGLIASLASIFTKVPFIMTAHGADVFGLRSSLMKKFKVFALKRAEVVTVVSNELKEAVERDLGLFNHIHVLAMGVNSKRFTRSYRDISIKKKFGIEGVTLLFVGRLSEKKGVSYLIDAMPLVLDEFPNTKLLIIGKGELEKQLKAKVHFLCLEQNVVFVGAVPNKELPEYYSASDIFIGPSIISQSGDTEGLGLTFIEAAMSGCLLIGTDVGGIGDIIVNNETGLLVPEKNSHAIASKILFGLRNIEKMEELKSRARQRCIQKYDWLNIARDYTILLKNVLKE